MTLLFQTHPPAPACQPAPAVLTGAALLAVAGGLNPQPLPPVVDECD